jgi:hypothetical protein
MNRQTFIGLLRSVYQTYDGITQYLPQGVPAVQAFAELRAQEMPGLRWVDSPSSMVTPQDVAALQRCLAGVKQLCPVLRDQCTLICTIADRLGPQAWLSMWPKAMAGTLFARVVDSLVIRCWLNARMQQAYPSAMEDCHEVGLAAEQLTEGAAQAVPILWMKVRVLDSPARLDFVRQVLEQHIGVTLLNTEAVATIVTDHRSLNTTVSKNTVVHLVLRLVDLTEACCDGWAHAETIFAGFCAGRDRSIQGLCVPVQLTEPVKTQARARLVRLWAKLSDALSSSSGAGAGSDGVRWDTVLADPRTITCRCLHALELCGLRRLVGEVERAAHTVCRGYIRGLETLAAKEDVAALAQRLCRSVYGLADGRLKGERDYKAANVLLGFALTHPYKASGSRWWRAAHPGEIRLDGRILGDLLEALQEQGVDTRRYDRIALPSSDAAADGSVVKEPSDETFPALDKEQFLKAIVMAPSEGQCGEDAGTCQICMHALQPQVDGMVAYLTCNVSRLEGPFHVLCARCVGDGALRGGCCPFCRQRAQPVTSAAEFAKLLPDA